MATYTAFPVFVDGVRLDSSAWGIDAKTRSTATVRSADVAVPGVDGDAASLNDDLDSTTRSYSMWVVGTDSNGAVPGGSNGMATCQDNLDQLTFLFSARHRLLDIQETWDAAGTVRQYWGKVIDTITPEVKAGGLARFVVSIKIPDGLTQDLSTADWTSTGTLVMTNTYEVTTLQGATGPINDAVILVTGPWTNPTLTDSATGAYVRLNRALAAGEKWRINVGTWSSRYGSSLTLASLDTDGTEASSITDDGGGNARYLRLQPILQSGLRRVSLVPTGSATTSASAFSVRARRKFLI